MRENSVLKFKMKNPMLKYRDSITSHLEFLGYTFLEQGNRDGGPLDIFTHSSRLNLFIGYTDDYITLIHIMDCEGVSVNLENINNFNMNTTIKVMYDTEGNSLWFQFYINYYEKNHFGRVLDMFESANRYLAMQLTS